MPRPRSPLGQQRNREIGERIRARREALQLTQAEVTRRMGVTRRTVYDWEIGRFAITREHAEALARVLDCDVAWFLGDQEPAVRQVDLETLAERLDRIQAVSRFLPIRLPSSVAWELRTAWATGRRVALSLDDRAYVDRLEGHITAVAATGAHVHLAGRHVPLDAVLAVHLPSRLGDSTARGRDFHGSARRVVPQLEELPL